MRFPKKPPRDPPSEDELGVRRLSELLREASPTTDDGRYLHWDDFRYRPTPAGTTVEEWWLATKWTRRKTPVGLMSDTFALPFGFVDLPSIQESLHRFDRVDVTTYVAKVLGDPEAPREYRVRLLIEEAISSSLIEGARPTTRDIARKMVRENRSPTSKDERMIMNNWRAMRRVVELVKDGSALRLEEILELHRILGDGALDIEGSEGQLRKPHHQVHVADGTGEVWHTPPSAIGIEERMERLLRFVNELDGPFIHPILRSIIAHFWMAFEHPFRDGNGRMARALFYWCMLRYGYELAEFLAISGPIDRNLTSYYRAFAFTETDDFDLTYFILHQLQVMHQAADELIGHLEQRAKQNTALANLIADYERLNHRQRALLNHAVRHATELLTIQGHAAAHRVHYMTARSDLLDLVARKMLQDDGGKPKRFTLTQRFLARVAQRKNP